MAPENESTVALPHYAPKIVTVKPDSSNIAEIAA